MKTLEQIQSGLDNNEFFLEYMPTMSLTSGQCVGAEALIRWRHNDEFISPLEFIPVTENTPLSGLLTYWVIEEIGRELGEWLKQQDGVHIGVNVSPDIIGRGGLIYAAKKAGLSDVVDKLMVEVTERGLPDEQALQGLSNTKGKVKIALDDFGAGDANMIQYSKIPADVLKIDKFFVDQITDTKDIPNIVKGLAAFALAMNFELIAEGVESTDQVDVLRKLGVHMVQGWFFSKSLRCSDFIDFHQQHSAQH